MPVLERAVLQRCSGVTAVAQPGPDFFMVVCRGRTLFVDEGRTNNHAITITCPLRQLRQNNRDQDIKDVLQKMSTFRWAKVLLPSQADLEEPIRNMLMIQAQLLLPTPHQNDPLSRLNPLYTSENLCRMLDAVISLASQI